MASKSIVETRNDRIVEFCSGGKTMNEIAEYVGMAEESLGNHMANLQMDKRIVKITPSDMSFGKGGYLFLFLKVGTELTHEPVYIEHQDKPDPRINHEFIRCSHRVLQVWAT